MPDPQPQLTQDDLKTMSSQAIVQARKAGQLDTLLGKTPPPDPAAPEGTPPPEAGITEADLKTMTPEAITEARRAGRLRHLGIGGG